MKKEYWYDKVITKNFRGKQIKYGFLLSKNSTSESVLIKVGQNGSITGYENKWVRMAKTIQKNYGMNVTVATNPFDGYDSIGDAITLLNDYYASFGIDLESGRVHYIGHSNGALLAAWYAYRYPAIEDMLLINMPVLEKLWDMTLYGLNCFSGNTKMVYGENDPNYIKGELLCFALPKIEMHVVENANHHFSNKLDEFILLADLLFS